MDHDDAIRVIRQVLAEHRGVDRIRFRLDPRCGISVRTVAPNTQTRPKRTEEQRELADYLLHGHGVEPLALFTALDPTLTCTFGSGFDIDEAGVVSNRHGSRARLRRAQRTADEFRWAQLTGTGFNSCW
jgi:hypothetical protein